jgi:phage terminase large subunit GpA-like protein
MVSTPTIKGFSRIEAAYQESDRRHYWVPCPSCQALQVLEWKQMRWPEGDRERAFYECIHCGLPIQDYQKGWMLAHGQWIAENPGGSKVAGFHLSSLYSPHGWTSWGDIALEHGQVYRDPSRLKVWVNTKLGETWEESAEQLDGGGLMARRELFGPMLPPGIVLLTAGVDVQDDRLELEIVGWGRDEESWSVAYWVLWGDPAGPTVWQDLENILYRAYPHARQVSDLYVRAAAVDTGGHRSMEAYTFCRVRQERRIWAIKGLGGMGKPIWPRRSSRNNKGRVPHFMVGVDAAKESIYSRLRLKESGPGYCHFPLDRDAEWFRQLTAEKVTTRYSKGRPIREWIKKSHERNEALDCRVYAMAALHGLMGMGLQLNKEADQREQYPLKEGVLLPEAIVAAPRIVEPKKPKVTEPKKPGQSRWLGELRDRWIEGRRR